MNFDITEKYFINKKNNILEYIVCMSKVLVYQTPITWKTDEEFKQILIPIINNIINKYYFNDNKWNEDRFCLADIINLIDNQDKEYLGLIFYLIMNLDYYNCSLIKNINLREFLMNKLNSIKNYKINYGKVDYLLKKLKDDYKKELNFFSELNSLTINNDYYCLSDKNNYFLVNYEFKLEELKNYKTLDINYITKDIKYINKLFYLSLINLNVLLLKEILLRGKCDTFFILYPDKYFDKKINIDKFDKMFSNIYLKSKVKLLIAKNNVNKSLKEINALKVKNISTMMSDNIDYEKLVIYKKEDILNRKEDKNEYI